MLKHSWNTPLSSCLFLSTPRKNRESIASSRNRKKIAWIVIIFHSYAIFFPLTKGVFLINSTTTYKRERKDISHYCSINVLSQIGYYFITVLSYAFCCFKDVHFCFMMFFFLNGAGFIVMAEIKKEVWYARDWVKNNTSGKKILVDDVTPDLSLIPSKDMQYRRWRKGTVVARQIYVLQRRRTDWRNKPKDKIAPTNFQLKTTEDAEARHQQRHDG